MRNAIDLEAIKARIIPEQIEILRDSFPEATEEELRKMAEEMHHERYKKFLRQELISRLYKKKKLKHPRVRESDLLHSALKEAQYLYLEDKLPQPLFVECQSSDVSMPDMFRPKKPSSERIKAYQEMKMMRQPKKVEVKSSRIVSESRRQRLIRQGCIRQFDEGRVSELEKKRLVRMAEIERMERQQDEQEYSDPNANARIREMRDDEIKGDQDQQQPQNVSRMRKTKPIRKDGLYAPKHQLYQSTRWAGHFFYKNKNKVGICYDCWKHVPSSASHKCHPQLEIKSRGKTRPGIVCCGYSNGQLYGYSYMSQSFVKGDNFSKVEKKYPTQPGWICLQIPRDLKLNTIFENQLNPVKAMYLKVDFWLEKRFALRGIQCVQHIRTGPFPFMEEKFLLVDGLDARSIAERPAIYKENILDYPQRFTFFDNLQTGTVIGPIGGDIIYSDFPVASFPTELPRYNLFPFTGATILSFSPLDPERKNAVIRFASNGIDRIYAFAVLTKPLPAGCQIVF